MQSGQLRHCDFCDEFSGGLENSFAVRYQNTIPSRVVLSTANFRVVPSLGQIIEGYLLIVPVSHYTAVADMPTELTGELSELCSYVRTVLVKVYGPCVFFEHGVRGSEAGGCGIDHAHLHAVPSASSSQPMEYLKDNHALKAIGGISEIHKEVSRSSPYLYYEETNGKAWTCEIGFIPSQYVRKLIAESLGVISWDWRECGREQALLGSIARLSEFFRSDSAGALEAPKDCPAQSSRAVAAATA